MLGNQSTVFTVALKVDPQNEILKLFNNKSDGVVQYAVTCPLIKFSSVVR
jgi:hypothetical protein